ncbi:FecR family protein [Chitinophaga niastensis]|uniref:FecR family protein n=1 Tax=Chitinophaga niastensis TaxID=536980 RepID=A0A2P8HNK0_CHINA|nr:FecR family protein [Chitinophaga niastensis]PSL47803.1 FecR family protein [Chitinophaga niastensis]
MKHFSEDTWEFIQDDRFIQWVLHPDAANAAYWEQWIAAHPHRQDAIEKAKAMVLSLSKVQQPAVDGALLEEVYAVLDKHMMEEQPAMKAAPQVLTAAVKTNFRYRWISAAAAVVAGMVMVSIYLKKNNKPLVAAKIESYIEKDQVIRTNKTPDNQVAYLTDGSTVVLKAGASIQHTTFLQHPKREVYLKGDAFFDIAKDARRPFFVYTPKVAICVLGTSFNVTEEKGGNLTIMVKTGKISVYDLADNKQHGYIVTPNHKIRFNARTAVFVADSLNIADAQNIPAAVNIPPFTFENTPVTAIFDALETAYSIKIHADVNVFGKCMVTTTMTNETFENKLKIICAAINATYKISGGQVYITGKPCS